MKEVQDDQLGQARAMNVSEDDVQYYQRRAEEELARAQQAVDPKIVSLHYELAELFLERVSENKGRQGGGEEGRGESSTMVTEARE